MRLAGAPVGCLRGGGRAEREQAGERGLEVAEEELAEPPVRVCVRVRVCACIQVCVCV
jgi:hypothetical protein